jgi:hypothetical protein
LASITAKQAAAMALLIVLALSGCAATPSITRAKFVIPEGYQARNIKFKDAIGEGIILEPLYKSKLETLRENAAIKNNKLTAEIAAGTLAAVTAYNAADSYFKSRNLRTNYFVSMAATAGSAYAAAAISGAIYDMFAPKINRHTPGF